jgi:hypothetical protein
MLSGEETLLRAHCSDASYFAVGFAAALYVALWERGVGPRTTIGQLVGAFDGLMSPEDLAEWTADLALCSALAKSVQLRSVAGLVRDADRAVGVVDRAPAPTRSSARVAASEAEPVSSSSSRASSNSAATAGSLTADDLALLRAIRRYCSRIVGSYIQYQCLLYAHCVLRRCDWRANPLVLTQRWRTLALSFVDAETPRLTRG